MSKVIQNDKTVLLYSANSNMFGTIQSIIDKEYGHSYVSTEIRNIEGEFVFKVTINHIKVLCGLFYINRSKLVSKIERRINKYICDWNCGCLMTFIYAMGESLCEVLNEFISVNTGYRTLGVKYGEKAVMFIITQEPLSSGKGNMGVKAVFLSSSNYDKLGRCTYAPKNYDIHLDLPTYEENSIYITVDSHDLSACYKNIKYLASVVERVLRFGMSYEFGKAYDEQSKYGRVSIDLDNK